MTSHSKERERVQTSVTKGVGVWDTVGCCDVTQGCLDTYQPVAIVCVIAGQWLVCDVCSGSGH